MWCPHCNSETTPVPSKTVDGSCCALCGERVFGSKPSDQSIRQARDIIAKWSASDLLDQISTLPDIPAMPAPHIPVTSRVEKTEPNLPETNIQPPAPATAFEAHEPAMLQPPHMRDKLSSELNDKDIHREDVPANEIHHEATAAEVVSPDALREPATNPQTTAIGPEPRKNSSQPPAPKIVVATEQPSEPEAERRQPQRQSEVEVSRTTSDAATNSSKQVVAERQDTNATNKNEKTFERPDDRIVSEASTDATKPIAVDSSYGRKEQPRQPLMRKQRERTRPEAELNKGLNTVNRKFRIDSPGGADNESNPPEQMDVESGNETNVAGGRIQSNSSKTGKRHRIDDGQPVSELLGTGDNRGRTHGRPRRRYIDEAHPATARGPHFQVTPQRRSNFTSMTGQFLAYLGVLGLTIGTAMVIYGHFGGYSDYTPTGWLVTTVAQMMLFLGVINLVSGGMEQTNDEVSQRINTLGEQLFRIEQVTEEVLRGPKINPRRYANPDEEYEDYEDSQREVASVRDRE